MTLLWLNTSVLCPPATNSSSSAATNWLLQLESVPRAPTSDSSFCSKSLPPGSQ